MQAGGQRFDPAQLHQFDLVLRLERTKRLWRVSAMKLSFEEVKVCIGLLARCLFCIHCEEKICLEASRCFEPVGFETSEPDPDDAVNGLADRKRMRDWG